MKKILLLGLLAFFGRAYADLVDKVNPYVDKYGRKAADGLKEKVNKVADEKLIKPLEEQNKKLTKIRDEQEKLFKQNAEDAAKRATLALWAKIKGWFSRK